MKKIRNALFCVAAASILFFWPVTAAHAAHWKGRSVSIVANTDAAWGASVQRAAAQWSAGVVRVLFAQGPADGPCTFADPGIVCAGNYGPVLWAGTTQTTVTSRGVIQSSFTRFNSYWSNIPRDHLACHEIGHVLGLQHSTDMASCMNPGSPVGQPAQSDFDRLRDLYRGR